jgi:hypothetical protein
MLRMGLLSRRVALICPLPPYTPVTLSRILTSSYATLAIGAGKVSAHWFRACSPRGASGTGPRCFPTGRRMGLPDLQAQRQRIELLIADRQRAFQARAGQPMSPGSIWLAGRLQEQDALGRSIIRIEQTCLAGGTTRVVRDAGVTARTAHAKEARRYAR